MLGGFPVDEEQDYWHSRNLATSFIIWLEISIATFLPPFSRHLPSGFGVQRPDRALRQPIKSTASYSAVDEYLGIVVLLITGLGGYDGRAARW